MFTHAKNLYYQSSEIDSGTHSSWLYCKLSEVKAVKDPRSGNTRKLLSDKWSSFNRRSFCIEVGIISSWLKLQSKHVNSCSSPNHWGNCRSWFQVMFKISNDRARERTGRGSSFSEQEETSRVLTSWPLFWSSPSSKTRILKLIVDIVNNTELTYNNIACEYAFYPSGYLWYFELKQTPRFVGSINAFLSEGPINYGEILQQEFTNVYIRNQKWSVWMKKINWPYWPFKPQLLYFQNKFVK